jgi:hypothetical protein
MKKQFYSHLVELNSLYIALDLLEMKPHERAELITIVDSSVHSVILDTVLSKLSEEDKKIFLSHLASEKHDEIWRLLNEKTKHIEKHIQKAANELIKEMHEDIKKTTAKHKKML